MQRNLKAIVSPFKGLRIEEFMKIHGSMPDQVQIRSFLTVGGPHPDSHNGSMASKHRIKNGLSDLNLTPQPYKYQSMKPSVTNGFSKEETKDVISNTPAVNKEIQEILDDL